MNSLASINKWYLNLEREDRSVMISYGMIVVLIMLGTILVDPKFSSPNFLIQQMRQASFLGIIAAGQMAVILTGNIDLSVAWTLNFAAVLATATAAGQDDRLILGVLVGLGVGALVGLVNGIGVAYLRIPSMVLTLGMNVLLRGATVVYSGSAPKFQLQQSPEFLSYIATEVVLGVLPLAVVVWGI